MEKFNFVSEIDHVSDNYLMNNVTTVCGDNEVVYTKNGKLLFRHNNGIVDILYSDKLRVILLDDMDRIVLYEGKKELLYDNCDVVIENITIIKKIKGIYGVIWYIKSINSEVFISTNTTQFAHEHDCGVKIYILNESNINKSQDWIYYYLSVDDECLNMMNRGIVIEICEFVRILINDEIFKLNIVNRKVELKNMSVSKINIDDTNYLTNGGILCYDDNYTTKDFLSLFKFYKMHIRINHKLETIKNVVVRNVGCCSCKTILITDKNIIMNLQSQKLTWSKDTIINFDNLYCEMVRLHDGPDAEIYYFENGELRFIRVTSSFEPDNHEWEYMNTGIKQDLIKKKVKNVKSACSMI